MTRIERCILKAAPRDEGLSDCHAGLTRLTRALDDRRSTSGRKFTQRLQIWIDAAQSDISLDEAEIKLACSSLKTLNALSSVQDYSKFTGNEKMAYCKKAMELSSALLPLIEDARVVCRLLRGMYLNHRCLNEVLTSEDSEDLAEVYIEKAREELSTISLERTMFIREFAITLASVDRQVMD